MRVRTALALGLPTIVFGLLSGCGSSGGQRSQVRPTAEAGAAGTAGQSSGNNGGGANLAPGSGGSLGPLDTDAAAKDPCESDNPPPKCNMKPSRAACGDGQKNQDSEECDDNNSLPGDGCSGTCKIEPYFKCPEVGKPCVSTIVCGDGELGPGEMCDDGNTKSGDGCSGDCHVVEIGYVCRKAGQACSRVYVCGDGRVDPNEGCDDGPALQNGDGCDNRCRIELGFKCDGEPSVCTATKCGDGKTEGAESCDDGNTMPFDGCSPNCRAEPTCPADKPCTSKCGDGIVFNEECDDGNLRDGDGCSSDCKIEDGFKCAQPELGDKLDVPVVYRDFKYQKPTDFEAGVTGSNDASTGLVKDQLDADGKPVYSGKTGNAVHIESTTTFGQWYRNTDGVNHATPTTLTLWNNGKGAFVNRYGEKGEQWNVTEPANWCGSVGDELEDDAGNPIPCTFKYQSAENQTDCLKEEAKGYTMVPGSCHDAQGTYKAQYIVEKVDGNPLFFPIDSDPFSKAELESAQVPSEPPGLYDASDTWPFDLDAAGKEVPHNFSFTSEVRYWFKYDSQGTPQLDFVGDDDVWVFINKKLAVDLGGIHTPVQGSVTLNAATATKLGLASGNVYEVAVFQAERQTTCSSYKLTLSGFNFSPSDCVTNCGDGEVAAGEECDDGPQNLGGYNQCSPTCTLGPRCGDGVKQTEYGEVCDEGAQGNTGAYGGCSPTCQLGPHCGDGVVTNDEQCDDGVNDGGYGECAPGCVLGPYCGDHITQAPEECDDGNKETGDGCTPACVTEVFVAH